MDNRQTIKDIILEKLADEEVNLRDEIINHVKYGNHEDNFEYKEARRHWGNRAMSDNELASTLYVQNETWKAQKMLNDPTLGPAVKKHAEKRYNALKSYTDIVQHELDTGQPHPNRNKFGADAIGVPIFVGARRYGGYSGTGN